MFQSRGMRPTTVVFLALFWADWRFRIVPNVPLLKRVGITIVLPPYHLDSKWWPALSAKPPRTQPAPCNMILRSLWPCMLHIWDSSVFTYINIYDYHLCVLFRQNFFLKGHTGWCTNWQCIWRSPPRPWSTRVVVLYNFAFLTGNTCACSYTESSFYYTNMLFRLLVMHTMHVQSPLHGNWINCPF